MEIDAAGNLAAVEIEEFRQFLVTDSVSINLVMDKSGSMLDHNRMTQAQNAAANFLIVILMATAASCSLQSESHDAFSEEVEQERTQREESAALPPDERHRLVFRGQRDDSCVLSFFAIC